MQRHCQIVHGVMEPGSFMCHRCGRAPFYSQSELGMHIVKTHINDHFCEKCEKNHETLEEFNNHLETCLEKSADYACKL